jgi:3-isopropylmalate/(R)-2-methylmalate dehydratase small subunit
MKPLREIRSRTLVLPMANIDTDQIIPARFLTTTSREGLGRHAFADWRYGADGTPRDDFALNSVDAREHRVLVAGRNFGCGSSREHAPWALLDFGLQAVISTEIADIFRNNALKNGLVPIVVDEPVHRWLLENPGAAVAIDLEDATLTMSAGAAGVSQSVPFQLEAFARYCLLNGIDELGFLLAQEEKIAAFERARHPGATA